MPLHVSGWDIFFRLLLSLIAGMVLGINRSEHGQNAGMRTTILVCLAAALSMVMTNLLLDLRGRPSDSFVMLDLMRLPLGILSGIGFIGAGAIFRRRDMVRGVTTAATLWFITIIGLCFGTGLFWLGIAGTVIGWFVLTGMKWLENQMLQGHTATVTLVYRRENGYDPHLRRRVELSGDRIIQWAVAYRPELNRETIRCTVGRQLLPGDTSVPDYVTDLIHEPSVIAVRWSG